MSIQHSFSDDLQPNYVEIDGRIFGVFTDRNGKLQIIAIDAPSRSLELTEGMTVTPMRDGKKREHAKITRVSRGPRECWTIEIQ